MNRSFQSTGTGIYSAEFSLCVNTLHEQFYDVINEEHECVGMEAL